MLAGERSIPETALVDAVRDDASKVPAITLGFWIIKVLATTLGETGGDAVSMSMNLGYLVGSAIFLVLFVGAVALQVAALRFLPMLYWSTIVASTTVGTTLADFADRSLGIGYPGGSVLLLGLLSTSLFVWHRTLGTVNVASVRTPAAEYFYWVTIMFSQTLGTALGDWTADSAGLGYLGASLVFGGLLLLVAWAYWRRWRVSHTALFWAAFILTRPLGATVGDFLDKPQAHGGLALSRYSASAVLLGLIIVLVLLLPQRPARKSH
ncbi:membrane protein [Lysobacter tyrosinilyticus]